MKSAWIIIWLKRGNLRTGPLVVTPPISNGVIQKDENLGKSIQLLDYMNKNKMKFNTWFENIGKLLRKLREK